jgi:FtsZ-interacting cell division protein YlmF
MGFMAGVWRMLGAEEEDADQRIVEYPQAQSRPGLDTMSMAPSVALSPALAPAATTIFIVKPELDEHGEPLFSLKEYASFLLTQQALVLDVNEVAAEDELHATRIVDYLSGVAEAVCGSVFEVTSNIFIFAPQQVQLAGDPLTPVEVN